jgi:hypothetical protein
VVERHGALYAAEYGWNASFEALVAQIVADFAAGGDPARDGVDRRAGGARAGSVFCARRDETAQLGLLWSSPPSVDGDSAAIGRRVPRLRPVGRARGSSSGRTTSSPMPAGSTSARASSSTEAATTFGHDLVEQTWSRPL